MYGSILGKYVPATADVIRREGEKAKMKLAGIVIVDGLCDPPSMMDYGEFLLNLGLIDEKQALHFKTEEDKIRALLAEGNKLEALHLWVYLIDSDKVTQPITYYNNVTGFKNKFNFLYAKVCEAMFHNEVFHCVKNPLTKRLLKTGLMCFRIRWFDITRSSSISKKQERRFMFRTDPSAMAPLSTSISSETS